MSVKVRAAKFPITQWSFRLQDLYIVSAFAMWSAILGLSPILVMRALASH